PRRIPPRPREPREEPRARARDLPAPCRAAIAARRHAVRRRAADAGDRPRPDGRAEAAHSRRALAWPLAAAGRGAVRADPHDPRRGRRAAAGRAERRSEPGGGAARLYPRQWPRRARGERGQNSRRSRAQARLPGYVSMAQAETLRSRLARKPIVVAPGVYDP